MEWWFRERYRLSPNDPRYLDTTREEMLLDFWTAYYATTKGESTFEAEDEDFDLDQILADAEEDWEAVPELSHG